MASAGFPHGEKYYLPWADVEVPAELLAAVFPLMDAQRATLEGNPRADLAAGECVLTLSEGRKYFLQVAPVVQQQLPGLGLWDYFPFTSDAFKVFRSTFSFGEARW